ncbi:hypothetical protein EG328_003572 [Venturia inaequalis]|uniref:Uncharacterized protein n=1 Tax=Venturia inaequalis TaxID=5025 RepID=A0A8H3YWV0_VENIN|nr:hypothetical protein EG327_009340 [Venturia inaequalis]KAE9974843.1 hypothetical protein EG328_003572 [Venturia inaequalis]RDI79197.1 hypothetical protein Vi05172_g10767 [Venturia inaequalis]
MKFTIVLPLLIAIAYAGVIDIHIDTTGDVIQADCYWDGTAPFCAGACGPGYQECGRSASGGGQPCVTGTKAMCCSQSCPAMQFTEPARVQPPKEEVVEALGSCYWEGTAPFCGGSCSKGYNECARSDTGDGESCVTGSKALCCTKECPNNVADQKPLFALGSVARGSALCANGEKLWCAPGATSNEECRCAPQNFEL